MEHLDEIEFFVPDLPAPEEWKAVEDEVEPAEVEPLKIQRLLAGLLDEVRPPEDFSAPTVMGWLLLWTRLFQGLEGLRGAAVRRSLYTARILSRSLFETNMHLRAIAGELLDRSSPWPWKARRLSARSRLHAYVAWSLYQDLTEWRHFRRKDRLSAIYEAKGARDYMHEYGQVVEAAGDLLESFETLTDAEAEVERKEAEEVAERKIAEIETWLKDEHLVGYWEDLQHQHQDDGHQSFFSFLLDDRRGSPRAALSAEGLEFAYAAYSRGSAVVHGTTVEGILAAKGSVLAPQVWSSDQEIESVVQHGVRSARNGVLALYLLRPESLEEAS